MTINNLRPFANGLVGEIEPRIVRIYDCNGYPRIEVYANTESDQELNDIADAIVESLNNGPK